jgi:hypothetical protein
MDADRGGHPVERCLACEAERVATQSLCVPHDRDPDTNAFIVTIGLPPLHRALAAKPLRRCLPLSASQARQRSTIRRAHRYRPNLSLLGALPIFFASSREIQSAICYLSPVIGAAAHFSRFASPLFRPSLSA